MVSLGKEWHEDIHRDKVWRVDRIWWYADTNDGKSASYSLNAKMGHKRWIIEIGNQQTLTTAPLAPEGVSE